MCPTCLSPVHRPGCPDDDMPDYDEPDRGERELIAWEMAINDVFRALPALGDACPVCQRWPCEHMRAAQLALMALDCYRPLTETTLPTVAGQPVDSADLPF